MINKIRTGAGFDAHRFCKGRPLILGGVNIPFGKGLAGHSDADVLLHAMIDALLGAAKLGDIGVHFPPEENRYKDISSLDLLEQTVHLLSANGWKIINIDSIIIAQAPKIRPYISAMEEKIGSKMPEDVEISIKATTTEGMGFTGREEGVAAMANCLIER